MVYDSVSNPSVTASGNQLTLQVNSLPFGTRDNFIGYFTIKPTAILGNTYWGYVTMTGQTLTAEDSALSLIGGAFDPNDKQGTPLLTPDQVSNGKYIDYTIRFQNTGTDTAFNVVIADTLNSMLKYNSLEMVATSHLTKTTVKDNLVYFEMPNILLPDSNINEPASHGFIRFRIKPKNTLVAGNNVPNRASIYFDFNSPIVTNNAITEIRNATIFPLTLIRFRGVREGNTDQLLWTTANEVNTKIFAIEKSTNGRIFSNTGFVNAKGNGNGEYSFTVERLTDAAMYYKLKMIDKDGGYKYSKIISIKGGTRAAFELANNPVKDRLVIIVKSPSLINSEARLINSAGVIVKKFRLEGIGNQVVSVSTLPVGVYYLQTSEGTEKVVVSKE
jgi:uncharacterized repeat protein (TIGR01451 family)